MTSSSSLYSGFVLEGRYEIVRLLGQGGFGRTYLAKDLNRFGEQCVLKEFAPQVQGIHALKKATELFQREAGVLYQLQHPQIPAFRELLQTSINGSACLLLIEDYVAGETYADLLHEGRRFTEGDIINLLQDLLPVLAYLHRNSMIHRDISPDNLICEQSTGKPILIDFGSVKRIVATAAQQLPAMPALTQIEKAGYTPIEQINGVAFPSSDLYALGVTMLVLLTNQSPLELYEGHSHTWQWSATKISTGLMTVLQHMLAYRDVDRYQSAHEVQQALQALTYAKAIPAPGGAVARSQATTAGSSTSNLKTWVVAPTHSLAPSSAPPAAVVLAPEVANIRSHRPQQPFRPIRWMGRSLFWIITLPFHLVWSVLRIVNGIFTLLWRLVVLALVLGVVALGVWWFKPAWLPFKSAWFPQWPPAAQNDSSCQEKILTRMATLGITTQLLYPQVNQKFYQRYPELQNRVLTEQPEDAKLRREWCAMADEILKASEGPPSQP